MKKKVLEIWVFLARTQLELMVSLPMSTLFVLMLPLRNQEAIWVEIFHYHSSDMNRSPAHFPIFTLHIIDDYLLECCPFRTNPFFSYPSFIMAVYLKEPVGS